MVLFDEKRFNLDGSDDFHYYWHYYRFECEVLSQRYAGYGSFMVWLSNFSFIGNIVDSNSYYNVLQDYLLYFAVVIHE